MEIRQLRARKNGNFTQWWCPFVWLSPIFAARCYASAAYAVTRCLSVRPSVTFFSWILSKRASISSKFFSPSGSETILVFPYQNVIAIFRQVPPNWGVKCRWGRHKWRFWTTSWLLIDEYNSARLTIGGRRCSSVSQLRCTSVYGTETATHQWICRREENRICAQRWIFNPSN